MRLTVLHGVAVGALASGALIAFVLRPAALVPCAVQPPAVERALPVVARAPATTRTPSPKAVVYVAGAVARPGVYAVAPGARAVDAVAKAGGLDRDADGMAVNLAAHVADGDEIAVPRIGEALPSSPSAGADSTKKRSRRGGHRRPKRTPVATLPADEPPLPQRIDLNTADATALATIPGVGATLAERIVDFRHVNGPFASVEGLADVSGMTPSRFDAVAPFFTVRSP